MQDLTSILYNRLVYKTYTSLDELTKIKMNIHQINWLQFLLLLIYTLLILLI
jgi:hypothetical protein